MEINKIYQGDSLEVLKTFPNEYIDCVVTSPPYWGLRDYGVDGQIGLEKTPEEYVVKMIEIFREVKRVLKKEGVMFLNLGDSYAAGGNGGGTKKQDSNRGTLVLKGKAKKAPPGLKSKDLVGIPWRIAFALQADGWYLRQDIIWAKPNPMPESVTDRCTKSHEYIFLLAKSQKYYFDNDSIRENRVTEENRSDRVMRDRELDYNSKQKILREYKKFKNKVGTWSSSGINNFSGDKKGRSVPSITHPLGRNKRSVWTVGTSPFPEAHFATFPEDLIVPMIKAGCPKGRLVLDPFMGAGTTAFVARKLQRNYIGIELNKSYIKIAERRLAQQVML